MLTRIACLLRKPRHFLSALSSDRIAHRSLDDRVGAVLFVGGAAMTGYTILSAPEDQRWNVAGREAVGIGGGILTSNVVVGVCFLFGMTGFGLLAVGVVAGVAGAYMASACARRTKSPRWFSR
jgi:hypothetical protein